MSGTRSRLRDLWRRFVRRADRFTEDARVKLLEATDWLAGRLRGPDPEIALDDGDFEVLTPWGLRRLEVERPELAFPRRPLAEAAVRRGWITVGHATILGLGPPLPRTLGRPNHRTGEPEPPQPAWMRVGRTWRRPQPGSGRGSPLPG